MKILVTGASGGLGKQLLSHMVGREACEIVAMVHLAEVSFSGCSTIKGDLLDRGSLVEATRGVDIVVHLAAVLYSNSNEEYLRVNVEGTKNLLEACVINGVQRFIHISSGAAHSDGGGYAQSKLRAEELVVKSGLKWIIVRPSEVYGPNSPDAINKLIKWIGAFPFIPVIGNGRYLLSPVYIDDAVGIIVRCVFDFSMTDKVLVIAGPERLTYIELTDRICAFLKVRRFRVFIPVVLAKVLAYILSLLGSTLLVRDQVPRLLCDKSPNFHPELKPINYHPRALEEGLSQCLRRM